jgi:integrase
MATIKQDGKVHRWQVKKDGIRRSGTATSERKAVIAAAKAEEQITDGLIGKCPKGATVSDLLEKYLKVVTPKKASYKTETTRIKAIQHDTLAAVRLDAVNESHVAKWRDQRLTAVSPDTVRREWTIITHAFKLAINEWRWLDKNPMTKVERPAPGKPRTRTPTPKEIETLQTALGWEVETVKDDENGRTSEALMFVLETALRSGELCALEWPQVNVEARTVTLLKTKNGDDRVVPLSMAAIRILDKMLPLKRPHSQYVFGLTVRQFAYRFIQARDNNVIINLHMHDFRAEALTRMAKKVPLLTLAKISGHRDVNMLQTYYRDTPTQIAAMLD